VGDKEEQEARELRERKYNMKENGRWVVFRCNLETDEKKEQNGFGGFFHHVRVHPCHLCGRNILISFVLRPSVCELESIGFEWRMIRGYR
jgi:hypothetical protein